MKQKRYERFQFRVRFSAICTFILLYLASHSGFVYADWTDSIPLISEIKNLFSKDELETQLEKVQILYKDKDAPNAKLQEAIRKLEALESKYPSDYRLNEWTAALYYRKGEWANAYKQYLLADEKNDLKTRGTQLLYNRANVLASAARDLLKQNESVENLKTSFALLKKAEKTYLFALKKKNDSKDIQENLKLVRKALLDIQNKLANIISHKQKGRDILILDEELRKCMRPFLSIDQSKRENLSLYLLVDELSNPIEDKKANLYAKFQCGMGNTDTDFSDISIRKAEYLNSVNIEQIDMHKVDSHIESLENQLKFIEQRLAHDSELQDPQKIKYIYQVIHIIKNLGDLHLKKSEYLRKESKDFEAFESTDKAMKRLYIPLMNLINQFFYDIPQKNTVIGEYLSSRYPHITKAISQSISVSLKSPSSVQSFSDLKKSIQNESESEFALAPSDQIDEGDITLVFDHPDHLFNMTSKRILADSLGMITSIQSKAYENCKKKMNNIKPFVSIEFDNFNKDIKPTGVEHTDNTLLTSSQVLGNQLLPKDSKFLKELDASQTKAIEFANRLNKKIKQVNLHSSIKATGNLSLDQAQIPKRSALSFKKKSKEKIPLSKRVLNKLKNYSLLESPSLKPLERNIKDLLEKVIDKINNKTLDIILSKLDQNTLDFDFLLSNIYKEINLNSLFQELSQEQSKNSILKLMNSINTFEELNRDDILSKLKLYQVYKKPKVQDKSTNNLLWALTEEVFKNYDIPLITIGNYEETNELINNLLVPKPVKKATILEANNPIEIAENKKGSLRRQFANSFKAGKLSEFSIKNDEPILWYSGSNYFQVASSTIGNKSRGTIQAEIERDIVENPNSVSYTRHIVPKDGALYLPQLSILSSITSLDTGENLTKEARKNYNKKTNTYFLPKHIGHQVEIKTYIQTSSSDTELNKFQENFKKMHIEGHTCSVDLSIEPSLKALVDKLKKQFGDHPSDSDVMVIVDEIDSWISQNILYSQSKKTALEYESFHLGATPYKSVFDYMLKIKKGDCDIHNGFLGCILAKEFNVPVRLALGYMGEEGVIYGDEGHGWLQIWLENKGGWISKDVTSRANDPEWEDKKHSGFSFNFDLFDNSDDENMSENLALKVSSCILNNAFKEVIKSKHLNVLIDNNHFSEKKLGQYLESCDYEIDLSDIDSELTNSFKGSALGFLDRLFDRLSNKNSDNYYKQLSSALLRFISRDDIVVNKAFNTIIKGFLLGKFEYMGIESSQDMFFKGISKTDLLFNSKSGTGLFFAVLSRWAGSDENSIIDDSLFKKLKKTFLAIMNRRSSTTKNYGITFYLDEIHVIERAMSQLTFSTAEHLNASQKNELITIFENYLVKILNLLKQNKKIPVDKKFRHVLLNSTFKEPQLDFIWPHETYSTFLTQFVKEIKPTVYNFLDKISKGSLSQEELLQKNELVSKFHDLDDDTKSEMFYYKFSSWIKNSPITSLDDFFTDLKLMYKELSNLNERHLNDLGELISKQRPLANSAMKTFLDAFKFYIDTLTLAKFETTQDAKEEIYKRIISSVNTLSIGDVNLSDFWAINSTGVPFGFFGNAIVDDFVYKPVDPASKIHPSELESITLGAYLKDIVVLSSSVFKPDDQLPVCDTFKSSIGVSLTNYKNTIDAFNKSQSLSALVNQLNDFSQKIRTCIFFVGGGWTSVSSRRRTNNNYLDFIFATLFEFSDDKKRLELFQLYLDSNFFKNAPFYPLIVLNHLAQFRSEDIDVSKFFLPLLKKYQEDKLLPLLFHQVNEKLKLEYLLLFRNAHIDDKDKIESILFDSQINFNLSDNYIKNPMDAKEVLTSILPTVLEVLDESNSNQELKPLDAQLYNTVTNLMLMSSSNQEQLKSIVDQIQRYIDDSSDKDSDFRKGILSITVSKTKTSLLERNLDDFDDTSLNRKLGELLRSWKQTSKLALIKDPLRGSKLKSDFTEEYLVQMVSLLNKIDSKLYPKSLQTVDKFKSFYKEVFTELNREEKMSHLFVIFNKIFEEDNSEYTNIFLYDQIDLLLEDFSEAERIILFNGLLENKKIVGNQKRLALLLKLVFRDENIENLDLRSSVTKTHIMKSYKLILSTLDALFLESAEYDELTVGIYNKKDLKDNVLVPSSLRKRFLSQESDIVVDSTLESIIGIRNFGESDWRKHLRSEYGVEIGKDFMKSFTQNEKIKMMSRAIAHGLLSPRAFFTAFVNPHEIKNFTPDEVEMINKNLTLGFFHASFDKFFGETWMDTHTGKLVLVDDLYYEYKKLSQDKKLEFIYSHVPPHSQEDLNNYNESFKKYGFHIFRPNKVRYQWDKR